MSIRGLKISLRPRRPHLYDQKYQQDISQIPSEISHKSRYLGILMKDKGIDSPIIITQEMGKKKASQIQPSPSGSLYIMKKAYQYTDDGH